MALDKSEKRAIPVLEKCARYYAEHDTLTPLKNKEIARLIGVEESTAATYLSYLRKAGLMTPENYVTEEGYAWLAGHNIVVPASIPIAGKVQAGRAEFDRLTRYIENIQDLVAADAPRLLVPQVRNAKKTIALRVQGDSMESDRIYEGDYVIVELFDRNEFPKDGELIIARYVQRSRVAHLEHSLLEAPDVYEPTELEGPTVKYCYQREGHYRLSPRRTDAKDKNVIIASSIDPWGRVVGVYRQVL